MFYLYQIFYKLTLNLSKLSILTLYLRVFDTRDWFGKITKCLIAVVVTFTLSILLANILICDPINTYWNTSPDADPKGRCINVLGYWYASSVYNVSSEAIMLLSVLVRIWTLPSHSQPPILQFRQKVNLTIVLGLGVFTVITAIMRVTTLDQAAAAKDKTGGTRLSTIWSSVEACLGLAVANLPMLRQLLRWRGWAGGHWFGSSADRSRSRALSNSRRRSEYTPAGMRSNSNVAPGQASRRPTLQDINMHGNISLSDRDIQMTRDFHRQVVTSDDGSDSTRASSDIEAQPFRHVDFSPSSPTAKSFKEGLSITSREIGTGGTSGTPSIASTLRNPATEPLPMVRISTEPVSTVSSTSSLASVSTTRAMKQGVRVQGVQLQSMGAAHVRYESRGLGTRNGAG